MVYWLFGLVLKWHVNVKHCIFVKHVPMLYLRISLVLRIKEYMNADYR